MNFDLRARTHLMAVGGSRAYGIHTEASDVDIKGVAVPPLSYHLGYLHRFDQADGAEHIAKFADALTPAEQAIVAGSKLEGVILDFRKFVALAVDCNPNILDLLFCRDEEVRLCTPIGRTLRENRDLFISQKAKHTFTGYAHPQLKRIRSHREWLLNPPKEEPTRTTFGLPEGQSVLPRDQLGAIDAMNERGLVDLGLSVGVLEMLDRERHYRAARTRWEQYQNWKRSRNPARAALEAQYGYDTKHGAHLVRLMRMGREIMETGKVNVWREDGDELRAIRAGYMPYDQLIEWAEREDAALSAMYDARTSPLPREPNRERVDGLCADLVAHALGLA